MYLWPHKVTKEKLKKGALLKQFIADLHSGKLHREFHHGPDKTEEPQEEKEPTSDGGHINKDEEGDADIKPKAPTTPPESTFKKLAPSKDRYTILRDEL